ncbi:hypothetical protein LVJ94_48240 [Pendulispora rubella]|uniref:Uncharacterized protein n=1 Tax=Pendulispora rubella TaxID=2741070 RepID=A0ABZ2L153_9BACT
MRLSRLVCLASSALVLVACSKPSDAPKESASAAPVVSAKAAPTAPAAAPSANAGGTVYSCNQPNEGMCAEWKGLSSGEAAEAKGSCNDPGAVFSTKPCGTKGVLATCEHPGEHVTLFLSKNEVVKSVKDAKAMCDDGKFTALVP